MFEDRSIRRKRRYLLAAVFLLLVSAAFGVGYYFNAEAPEETGDSANPGKVNLQIPDSLINPTSGTNGLEPVNADSEADTAVNMPDKDLMTPNTQLIFKTYFNSCKHTIEKSVRASDDEVNMNEEQLKEKYAGWNITFSPPVVELNLAIDAYCPKHFIIGVDTGYITVFVYDETGQKKIWEKTDIAVSTLTPNDQEKLQYGIVVDTEDELDQTLEGFSN